MLVNYLFTYDRDLLLVYLSQGHNAEQAQEADSEEESHHPANGERLNICRGVSPICLGSYLRTHSQHVTGSTTYVINIPKVIIRMTKY